MSITEVGLVAFGIVAFCVGAFIVPPALTFLSVICGFVWMESWMFAYWHIRGRRVGYR